MTRLDKNLIIAALEHIRELAKRGVTEKEDNHIAIEVTAYDTINYIKKYL